MLPFVTTARPPPSRRPSSPPTALVRYKNDGQASVRRHTLTSTDVRLTPGTAPQSVRQVYVGKTPQCRPATARLPPSCQAVAASHSPAPPAPPGSTPLQHNCPKLSPALVLLRFAPPLPRSCPQQRPSYRPDAARTPHSCCSASERITVHLPPSDRKTTVHLPPSSQLPPSFRPTTAQLPPSYRPTTAKLFPNLPNISPQSPPATARNVPAAPHQRHLCRQSPSESHAFCMRQRQTVAQLSRGCRPATPELTRCRLHPLTGDRQTIVSRRPAIDILPTSDRLLTPQFPARYLQTTATFPPSSGQLPNIAPRLRPAAAQRQPAQPQPLALLPPSATVRDRSLTSANVRERPRMSAHARRIKLPPAPPPTAQLPPGSGPAAPQRRPDTAKLTSPLSRYRLPC